MPTPHALYLTADLRRIEQSALAAHPAGTLMQRAAAAVARQAMQMLGAATRGARILVLAGPGNNGGDALLAAVLLQQSGARPLVMASPQQAKRPPEAERAFHAACAAGLDFIPAAAETIAQDSWNLVLDGLFGIGLARPLSEEHRRLIEAVNGLRCPVLAIDIPSGLGADTGMPVGPDGIAVRASQTITFIGDKPGLHTGRGRDHAGTVTVDTLDIPESRMLPATLHRSHPQLFADALRPRAHYSHKGIYGDLALVGGATGMGGALVLAARAALHAGAGRVFAGFLDTPPCYDGRQPELMCKRAADLDFSSGATVIGPGLGQSGPAKLVLRRLLSSPSPVVIDADALNLVAADPALQSLLARRTAPALLTPHPLEAARLLGGDTASVQADRVAAARLLAQRCNAIVVLKGSGSVIAAPGGAAAINPTGNPALATGGTGDVLAGVCGALLAQGVPTWQAAMAAAWMHGAAADDLVREGVGPVGLTAGELAPAIRAVLNRLIRSSAAGDLPQS